MQSLIGKKVGMTQIFNEDGDEIPVTILEMGPCPVVDVMTDERNGYRAAQIAFEPIVKKDETKVVAPKRGHFAKAGVKPHRFLREIPLADGEADPKIGDALTVDIFADVHYVSVTGVSKGRGFAGVIKRHGMKGAQTMSHGTHEAFRHGGSIGMHEWPARVLKGHRMAGHYGAENVKQLNLEIIRIFSEENLMLVRGAVPGANGGLVYVERSVRKERRTHVAAEPKFVNPLKAAKRGGGK
jgi:large subunit ribosomal protein L3